MKTRIMIAVFLLGLTIFSPVLFGESPDQRTYDQIAAVTNKNVVDEFLLCPDIGLRASKAGDGTQFEVTLGSPEARDETHHDRDIQFRQKLLNKGEAAPGVVVSSVIADLKNAYIKIDGHDAYYRFSMVFVYFENADRARIPAVTFHASAQGEETDFDRFYDLSHGSWQVVPDQNIHGSLSAEPLIPYAGQGDTSQVQWILELPRYGTSVRFVPLWKYRGEEDPPEVDAKTALYLEKLKTYALECSWNKAQSRFDSPTATLADKTDIPKSDAVAADFYPLLHPAFQSARQARDAWRADKSNPLAYFEAEGDPDEGNAGDQIKILGQYRGFPLVAEVYSRGKGNNDFSLWLYHGSGLLEPADLLVTSMRDFYRESHKARVPATWPKGHAPEVFSISADGPAISIALDSFGGQETELVPDFTLNYVWKDQKAAFLKIEKPIDY